MKKILIKIAIIVFSFITLSIGGVFFLMHSSLVLVGFNINEVKYIYHNFIIKFDKVKAAVNYKVEIVDSNANVIYSFYTNTNDNQLMINNITDNKDYSLMVYAYDKKGNYVSAKKSYDFHYEYPYFNKDKILLNNTPFTLNINGNLNDKTYSLNISSNNQTLYNEIINNNSYEIPIEYYQDKDIKLDVNLVCNDIIVDTISLYNGINPIGDISIKTPVNDSQIIYNNLSLIYEGGDNADETSINIYDGKKVILSKNTNKKNVLISESMFVPGKKYCLDIVGSYKDYTKTSSVNFEIVGRAKLKPVYININPKAVKKGSEVVLKQPENGKIYYTIDGSDPTTNGIEYTNPIVVNESMTLKTVAKLDLFDDSKVSTYNFNVIDKKNLKIYISPSNQGANLGVKSTGFTSEKIEMNKVADYVIEKLKEYDIKVYRNNPNTGINQWNLDANYLNVDFKLAIHSNASIDHSAYGIETWVDSEDSETYSIASLIQDTLVDMYPYKDRDGFNRGVRYALGEIGEVNDNYVRFGALVEIAHHDDELDAKWIKDNEKEIGYRLAEAILKYFQVI